MATELIERRTLNSKTFHLGGNKYALDVVTGAIHYRDNPGDESEPWQDIDTTIEGSRITRAPYDLDIYLTGMPGFHYRSKDSGEFDVRLEAARMSDESLTTIQPDIPLPRIEGNKVIWENVYPDVDVVLEARNTRVTLKRILKSDKAPPVYDIDVQEIASGVAKLLPVRPAVDAGGQELLMEEKPRDGGRTEILRWQVISDAPQPVRYPVEDATEIGEQVGASTDDCFTNHTYQAIYLNAGYLIMDDSDHLITDYVRFDNVTIPSGATIDTASIDIKAYGGYSGTTYQRIYGIDEDDTATFSTYADAEGRDKTTAYVDWTMGNWTGGQWYGYTNDMKEIKTIIAEITSREGWASGQALGIALVLQTNGIARAGLQYDNAAADAPKLNIEYTVDGGVEVTPDPAVAMGLRDSPRVIVKGAGAPFGDAKYAVIYNLTFGTQADRDAMADAVDAELAGKSTWGTTCKVKVGDKEHLLEVRFNGEDDMDDLFWFTENKIRELSATSGSVVKHYCAHACGVMEPCRIIYAYEV